MKVGRSWIRLNDGRRGHQADSCPAARTETHLRFAIVDGTQTTGTVLPMEPQANKSLAVQKAIHAHDQAAAALADLQGEANEHRYSAMLARIDQNLAELQADSEETGPEDLV